MRGVRIGPETAAVRPNVWNGFFAEYSSPNEVAQGMVRVSSSLIQIPLPMALTERSFLGALLFARLIATDFRLRFLPIASEAAAGGLILRRMAGSLIEPSPQARTIEFGPDSRKARFACRRRRCTRGACGDVFGPT